MKSVNPELSQRLDEITTDKLNTSTTGPDIIQSEEEETHLSKDDDHKGINYQHMTHILVLCVGYIDMWFMYTLLHILLHYILLCVYYTISNIVL